MTNREDHEWIRLALAGAFEPREYMPIDEWVEKVDFMLPSNTAEPGRYDINRAPYQKMILHVMSPEDPARVIVLDFGSQMGKTTSEILGMSYYMRESPSPIGFGFSDDANLRNFVKAKFDPVLAANPEIRALLRSMVGRRPTPLHRSSSLEAT